VRVEVLLIVSATREELGDLPGQPLGLGAVVSAATMGALVERERPDAVVMLGTGGAYRGGPALGTAVAGRRFGLSAGVAALGLGYVPHPPSPIEADLGLLSLLTLPRVDVLTVQAITTDADLADRLSDGWQMEHMETYGAAWACARAGVPFAAVLGITSQVGPEAHTQWLLHRHEAQACARAAVAPLLAAMSGEQAG
jgi:nucleoside phosphorylase